MVTIRFYTWLILDTFFPVLHWVPLVTQFVQNVIDNVGIYVTSWVVKKIFIYLVIYLFIISPVLNSRGLKCQTTEIMSGMVTMRARKLRACQLGMSRWSVRRQPASAGKRTSFHGGPSSPQSNAFWFVPRTPGCWHSWVQVFPVPLERSCGCRWVSCTYSFFWQLRSQQHWHWWWHSAADKRFPECRPLWRPKWRCAQSSMAAMSNRQAACRRHGPACVVPSSWERRLESKRARWQQCCRRLTRLSSSVVLCNRCIVAKRCKIRPRLLLITNRKSNTDFQLTLKSMTLDDLERTVVCQSCGVVATRYVAITITTCVKRDSHLS